MIIEMAASMAATSNLSLRNRILAALPAAEHERLLPNLKPVTLAYKQVLSEPNKTIRYVYFPNDGIISMLSTVIAGTPAEVGLVGREGMFGIPGFFVSNSTPHQD